MMNRDGRSEIYYDNNLLEDTSHIWSAFEVLKEGSYR